LLSRGIDQHRRSVYARTFVLCEYCLECRAIFRSAGIRAEEVRQVINVFEGLVCTLSEVLSIS
jgi:hypothetical protein